MKKELNWKDLFVIAGLKFREREFSNRVEIRDTRENTLFVKRVVNDATGVETSINEAFSREVPNIHIWMNSLTKHGGKCSEEMYLPSYIKLNELDVMMLGVIRQLNNMNIETNYSCSGHSLKKPRIGFVKNHDAKNAMDLFEKLGFKSTFISNTVLELNLLENELIDLALELYYLISGTEKLLDSIRKQRKLNLLESLLMVRGKSGNEQEIRKVVYSQIETLVDSIKVDEYGNLLASKTYGDGNTILLSAHLDVVASDIDPNSNIINQNGVLKREHGILGADDRAGISIIINILNELSAREFKGTLKIAFTVEEEIGRFGAENIDKDFFSDIDFAISLDRRNSSDIVTHSSSQRYCSEEFGMMLQEFSRKRFGSNGYRCVRGGISDLTVWSAMGIESVNLSIGFYNEHTSDEYLIIDEWLRTHEFAKLILRRLGTLGKDFDSTMKIA